MTGKSTSGKLPGKTEYAGRRRSTTRTSGFKVHDATTGGEFIRYSASMVPLSAGQSVRVTFTISGHPKGALVGYGLWFTSTKEATCTIVGGPDRRVLTNYGAGSWNKAGSLWFATDDADVRVTFQLSVPDGGSVAIYSPACGRVRHKHLDGARPELMRNIHLLSPEALFIDHNDAGEIILELGDGELGEDTDLILKSCNRCGRYLPINVPEERNHLSFSNHCVAAHRLPCKHATFGRLRNESDAADTIQLQYGFQLECRFCKKFEVNAAHNPQRTPAQMKEDGARRRAFELLLAELYGGTPQLRYRHETSRELADDVWKRFNGACFNCGKKLASPKAMHLDHTRPLASLWPLDGTATALCGSCNSEKRDRPPSLFYTLEKRNELAEITGIPLNELNSPQPNVEALNLLLRRIDWFFDEFLAREDMKKERDGKITGELVVKALQKVFSASENHKHVDLPSELNRRRTLD